MAIFKWKMTCSGLLSIRKKATHTVKRKNIIFTPGKSPFRKRLHLDSMPGKMNNAGKESSRNVHGMCHDVKVIKDTLLLLGKQNKSTSNQLTKRCAPLENDILDQRSLLAPADCMQSDTESISSVSSNDTEDGIIRRTGFQTKCMASAIQSWFCDILKSMLFSAVNDEALEKGIVTAEEHEKFRKMTDEENAKRMLICSVMDKSYDTMISFVDIIRHHSEDLRDSIMSTFDESVEKETRGLKKECIRCLIERRCDLVMLCDFLFTHKLINRDFFNVVMRSAPKKQPEQWSSFFDKVTSTAEDGYALSLIRNYLSGNGQYVFHSDIVEQIDRDLKRGKRSLKCRCRPSRDMRTPSNELEKRRMRDSSNPVVKNLNERY